MNGETITIIVLEAWQGNAEGGRGGRPMTPSAFAARIAAVDGSGAAKKSISSA